MNEELLFGGKTAGEGVLDLWTNFWARSIDGSWIVRGGVIVPSADMIRLSPQENGCSADARVGNMSGVPAYLGSPSLKVSDRIPEEDVMDDDEGELRFGVIPKFGPLKNSTSTKSRFIGKSGYRSVQYTFDRIKCRCTLGICRYSRRFETFYRN